MRLRQQWETARRARDPARPTGAERRRRLSGRQALSSRRPHLYAAGRSGLRPGRQRILVRRNVPRAPHRQWRNLRHGRLSAAHPTLPLPVYARVTNLNNGRTIVVRINDRGPYARDRIIDLSRRSAELLGFRDNGTATVRVKYLGRAPLNGDDSYERKYLASQSWMQVAANGKSSKVVAVAVSSTLPAENPENLLRPWKAGRAARHGAARPAGLRRPGRAGLEGNHQGGRRTRTGSCPTGRDCCAAGTSIHRLYSAGAETQGASGRSPHPSRLLQEQGERRQSTHHARRASRRST